jgi:predicted RNA-binding protein Jag
MSIAIQVWRKLKPKVLGSMHPVARRVLHPTVSADDDEQH